VSELHSVKANFIVQCGKDYLGHATSVD